MAKKTHQDILNSFNTGLTKAEDSWKHHLRKFKEQYEVYFRSEKRRKEEKDKGHLYVDHVYQQIETIVPRLVIPDFKFDLEPREAQDELQVRALQRKVDYDLDVDDFIPKQVEMAKTALICGVCVAKVIWDKKCEYVKVHDFEVPPMEILAGAPTTKVVEREIKNGPTLLPVNLWDFFPDPSATSIDSAYEVYHRTWLTEDELKAREKMVANGQPIYKNIKKALSLGAAGNTEENLGNESMDEIDAKRGAGRFEVIERWRRGRLTTVVNRAVVIRDTENPYWHGQIPFVAACTQPDIRSFVGISEVEVIDNIARMIHKFENIRLRAAEFAINPVLKIHRSLKGANKFQWLPGERIYLDRMDQIVPETAVANLQAGWDEIQAYLGYMQQVSGVSPYMSGADPSTSGVDQSTATGATILREGADTRIQLKLIQMQVMYAKVAKMFVALNQQFITKPQLVKIIGIDGEQWVSVKPEDISGAYDVRTNVKESLSRVAEIQKYTEALNTLMPMHGIPMADGTVADVKYPLMSLLEAMGLDPNRGFAQAPAQPPMGMPQQ